MCLEANSVYPGLQHERSRPACAKAGQGCMSQLAIQQLDTSGHPLAGQGTLRSMTLLSSSAEVRMLLGR